MVYVLFNFYYRASQFFDLLYEYYEVRDDKLRTAPHGGIVEIQGIPIVDDGYSRQPNVISGKH